MVTISKDNKTCLSIWKVVKLLRFTLLKINFQSIFAVAINSLDLINAWFY
jgi:hypothetical protein